VLESPTAHANGAAADNISTLSAVEMLSDFILPSLVLPPSHDDRCACWFRRAFTAEVGSPELLDTPALAGALRDAGGLVSA
jgi:hypothetical protein